MPRPPLGRPYADALDADVIALATRAFGRATGAQSSEGNAARMLLDARENFPAWLDAIRRAQRLILFECYIVEDDEVGHEFARALADRARDGVHVYVIYDWLGSFRSDALWGPLREAGVRVAAFNPFQFASPLGWTTRDHRKMIAIDGHVGFVSGLCVSAKWLGRPEKRLEPWRDTGVEIRGPAVAELEHAFARVWEACDEGPLPVELLTPVAAIPRAGTTRVRVIQGQPSGAGVLRLDLMIAAIARERLWLTDAYFVGTAPYVQALVAAARDGVDVRLLVPGASDLPAVSVLSRAGYRVLLEKGVRVFEWNGTMLHAKTAVADDQWARVGSTNLNLASFLGNYELDVAIEDEAFARATAEQFERDLRDSTEIVLTAGNRVRRADRRHDDGEAVRRAPSGSAGRAAAGAVSVGSALGAALTNRRALGPAESGLLAKMAVAAIALGAVGAMWPAVLAWPAAVFAAWMGLAWLGKAWGLHRAARRHAAEHAAEESVREAEVLARGEGAGDRVGGPPK
ncbi:MAG: phospholipase D-like domain-containing protein [Betaproteobacteria bacterium]|nr:phospholipase D-like domain-containing protein [Betaproteobacteria bacterium]